MSTVHRLDVRWLEPPEPMVEIVGALERMQQGEVLEVLIHREPYPLYQILARDGYAWRTAVDDEGNFVLTIERAARAPSSEDAPPCPGT